MRESPFIFPLSFTKCYGSYLSTQCSRIGGNSHYGSYHPSISVWRGIFTPFFIKPKLKVISVNADENVDRRWGKTEQRYGVVSEDQRNAELPYEYYPLRHFINVIVENQGNDPARNCEIRSKLLRKYNGCRWLSDEEKSLVWDDGTSNKTIRAKGGKAIFHLAFSQQSLTRNQERLIPELFCGVTNGN